MRGVVSYETPLFSYPLRWLLCCILSFLSLPLERLGQNPDKAMHLQLL